jgi:hypothetical protein
MQDLEPPRRSSMRFKRFRDSSTARNSVPIAVCRHWPSHSLRPTLPRGETNQQQTTQRSVVSGKTRALHLAQPHQLQLHHH